MTNTSAYIFPETVPGDEILFPLVQVFKPLVYCRAVEDDEIPEDLQSTFARELDEKKQCAVHVPSPLGEQRERFLALINDLKNRRDDYAAQLKNLSLSGIGKGGRARGESKNSIIENLLQSNSVAREKQEKHEMLLWQARLLLKLGEIFDADQVSLQRDLDKISQLESGLFSELRKEQGDPYAMTKNISSAIGQIDGLQRLRLKAWTRLFCLGAEQLKTAACFVTTNKDAVELLVEEYEQLCGKNGQRFLEVVLPTVESGEVKIENIQELRKEKRTAGLQEIIADPAKLETDQAEDFASLEGRWAGLLERFWPTGEYGRCRLHLYSLPEVEVTELFMSTFGRDEDYSQVDELEAKAGGVVGWLEL